MSDAPVEEEWVELRRYNDPIEADMARDFLKLHGVRVSTRGNSGVTGVLNRFDTILDIRLVVPKSELDAAREAIEALNAPERQVSPFRGFGKESGEREDEEIALEERPVPRVLVALAAIAIAAVVLDYWLRG